MLGPLHVVLHVTVTPDGAVSAKVDSPDQYMYGVPCSDVVVNGPTISLTVPSLRGEWMGSMSTDHNSLTGIWKQGSPVPLNFTRTGAASSGSGRRLPLRKSLPLLRLRRLPGQHGIPAPADARLRCTSLGRLELETDGDGGPSGARSRSFV